MGDFDPAVRSAIVEFPHIPEMELHICGVGRDNDSAAEFKIAQGSSAVLAADVVVEQFC